MKLNKKIALVLIPLIVLFTGCKTSKIANQQVIKTTDTELILQKAYESQAAFETMNISNISMQASYANHSFTFRGSLRIITDSVISFSIQPMLGIEMFRVEFTTGNFAIYDKMNRRYSENNYEYLKYQYGLNVSYDVIQAIFSQHLFTLESTLLPDIVEAFEIVQSTANNDTVSLLSKEYIFSTTKQRFDINRLDNHITFAGVELDDKSTHGISFNGMAKSNQIEYPKEVELNAEMNNKEIEAKLSIEKIAFNRTINITPINKTRYKKVTVTDILKSL